MILGIDQGTTSTRACVMDGDGTVVARASLEHRQVRPSDGCVEHDPIEIARNTREVARRALAEVSGRGGRVRAIALANQGETVMLWDRATGEPLHHALVWQDTRTQPWVDALAADPALASEVRRRTGLRLDSYFSAPKLRWLLHHAPGAREALARGRLAAGTLDTWLIWTLTGGRVHATDASTAARTLLFDLRTLAWDPWLLDRFGVPAEILPDVRASVDDFGEAPELGAPIAASLVDQPAALVGEGCVAPGGVKATFGTGCFVYLNTGSEPATGDHGLLSTVAWRRDGATTYALDGGVLAAGTVVSWLRDDLGLVAGDAELDLAAAGDAGSIVCVPALVGLGAPHWDRGARAAWLGVGTGATRGQLVRAALDGIACRVAEVLGAMRREGGVKIERLRVDGGLTACATLMQRVADLGGVAVEVSAEPEATVVGACALAARGVGLWSSDEPIVARARERAARIFTPAISADERGARLERFARAVSLIRVFAAGS